MEQLNDKANRQDTLGKGCQQTNNTGVQMRAMPQCIENEAEVEQLQKPPNPDTNPTVELHKTKEEAIKEFIQKNGTIALDWYVSDFCNTRVGDLIEQRLPLETTKGRILFSCPVLSKFFKRLNFELGLKTGRIYTYLDPPEDIGVSCQKEEFNPEFLKSILQGKHDVSMVRKEKLESKENGRTSRCHGPRGSRIQNMSVLPTLDPVCNKFS